MNLRISLLAVILALAATALHAEEFQFSFTGLVICPPPSTTCNSPTGPSTITFGLNSLDGVASPTFAHDPPGGPPGDIVDTLSLSGPLTNYFETLNGHPIAFAAHGSFGFNCFGFPIGPDRYECNGGAQFFGITDNELWVGTLTQAQFNSFKDPLASVLLLNPGSTCSGFGVSSFCKGFGGDLQGQWTFTTVPAPGPLLLFLAGLVGLVVSRRRERLRFLVLWS